MIYFIIGIITLIIIGFIANVISVRECSKNYDFIVEYREKFSKFISDLMNKDKYNTKEYEFLISNSDKIQMILGNSGKMLYRDSGGYYPNYEVVINFMNEVLSLKAKGLIEYEGDQITWCHNSFLRKMGIIDEYREKEIRRLFNPIYDLTSGIRIILGIPLDILYSVGLVSSTNKEKMKKGKLFKFFSGIFSLVTVISTIMSFVLDWNDFIDLIKGFLQIS